MKLGVFKQRQSEFYDRSKFKAINDSLEIYETTYGKDHCIVTWSKARAERDQKAREDILKKIMKKLKAKNVNSKKIVSNKNYQKYLTGLDVGKPEINQKAILEESKKDGFFGVVTNIKNITSSVKVGRFFYPFSF